MSRGKVKRYKNKANSGSFYPLPRDFVRSKVFRGLSLSALKLFLELLAQYNGYNNGELTCRESLLKEGGMRGKKSIQDARHELLEKNIIMLTRQGSKRVASLYALTIYSLDESKVTGVTATRVPIGGWSSEK